MISAVDMKDSTFLETDFLPRYVLGYLQLLYFLSQVVVYKDIQLFFRMIFHKNLPRDIIRDFSSGSAGNRKDAFHRRFQEIDILRF